MEQSEEAALSLQGVAFKTTRWFRHVDDTFVILPHEPDGLKNLTSSTTKTFVPTSNSPRRSSPKVIFTSEY
jgi:hypothetical protein